MAYLRPSGHASLYVLSTGNEATRMMKPFVSTHWVYSTGAALALALLLPGLYAEGASEKTEAPLTRIAQLDFEDEEWPDALSPPGPDHFADIVVDPDDPENRVLRITFSQGAHYGASLHIALADDQGEEPLAARMRYRIRFDESWRTVIDGKLPGFSGTYGRGGWGGRPSDGYNGWSARGMFLPTTEDGRLPIGAYVYHTGTREGRPEYVYGDGMSYHADEAVPPLESGQWHGVEQYLRLNTLDDVDEGEEPGQSDGVLRAWINDRLVFERGDLCFRHTDDLRIQTVWLNFYHGGKDPAPRPLTVYIDDIEVFVAR